MTVVLRVNGRKKFDQYYCKVTYFLACVYNGKDFILYSCGTLQLTEYLCLIWFLQQLCKAGRTCFMDDKTEMLSHREPLLLHCCVPQFRNFPPNSTAEFSFVSTGNIQEVVKQIFLVSMKLFRKNKTRNLGVSWPERIWRKTLAKVM